MEENKNNQETPVVPVVEETPATPVVPSTEGEGNEPATLADVVAEMKELRKERGIFKELYEGVMKNQATPETPVTPANETEVQKEIRIAIEQDRADRAKADKQATLENFIAANKEYSSDNDPTGLKRAALVNKLKSFDTESMGVPAYMQAIRDAHRLAGGSDSTPQNSMAQNPYSVTPTTSSTVQTQKDADLSDAERDLLKKTGYSPEKFKELKAKNPDFVKQLLKQGY